MRSSPRTRALLLKFSKHPRPLHHQSKHNRNLTNTEASFLFIIADTLGICTMGKVQNLISRPSLLASRTSCARRIEEAYPPADPPYSRHPGCPSRPVLLTAAGLSKRQQLEAPLCYVAKSKIGGCLLRTETRFQHSFHRPL